MKKCPLEPSAENSGITLPKSLLGDRTIMLDDIENWNPDLAVMMTPVEIKKQLIHSRSSKSKFFNFNFFLQIISCFAFWYLMFEEL